MHLLAEVGYLLQAALHHKDDAVRLLVSLIEGELNLLLRIASATSITAISDIQL